MLLITTLKNPRKTVNRIKFGTLLQSTFSPILLRQKKTSLQFFNKAYVILSRVVMEWNINEKNVGAS